MILDSGRKVDTSCGMECEDVKSSSQERLQHMWERDK